MSTDRRDQLRAIRDAVVNLSESPLYEYRLSNSYYPVIGQGDHYADIMFIGEAPGKNEAETGRPFCGASGRVLDELLESIDLKREDVYVTNILKDRPPNNRDPLKNEIELYTPFLEQQIEIIQPKGDSHPRPISRWNSSCGILAPSRANQKISQLHGTVVKVRTSYGPSLGRAALSSGSRAIQREPTRNAGEGFQGAETI